MISHLETQISPERPKRAPKHGAALPDMQPWAPELRVVPLDRLAFNPANPRGDIEERLDDLVASLDVATEPFLVQPPTVELQSDGTYLVQMGERRIRAALRAGWQHIACLVIGQSDPFTALLRRMAENMQRRDLHPLDAAAGLKNAWLYANAVALGAGEQARMILSASQPPLATLGALAELLADAGFVPTHPPVTHRQILARLGLAVSKDRLKQLLKVLALDNAALREVRALDMTEAAIRSLAALEPEQQRALVAEIRALPALGRHVRWIVVSVRSRGYTFHDALAQAKRRAERLATAHAAPLDALPDATVLGGLDALADELDAHIFGAAETAPAQATGLHEQAAPEIIPAPATHIGEGAAMERALPLLEAANAVHAAGADLLALLDGQPLAALPEPWREYVLSAAQIIAATLKSLPLCAAPPPIHPKR